MLLGTEALQNHSRHQDQTRLSKFDNSESTDNCGVSMITGMGFM